jgi:Tol biopolymer transport system component
MRRILVLAWLAFLAAAADVFAVPDGSTVLVDRPSGFGALPFDGGSGAYLSGWARSHTVSADGCFVVFSSNNDVLLATDDDSAINVYRVNRCVPARPVEQVNTSLLGVPAGPGSYSASASISADGRFVAFATDARDIVQGFTGTSEQFVVKDMVTGHVEIVSRGDGANGSLAPGAPLVGVISGDGRAVAFSATGALHAKNASGADGQVNVYVRFYGEDRTVLASVKADGTPGGGNWFGLDISHTGDAVAFDSDVQLVSADTDSGRDAYLVRGILAASPSPTLVSWTKIGSVGNDTGADSAEDVAISSDGTWVGWTNNNPWVARCSPACSQADRMDWPAPEITVPQQVDEISFGHSLNTTTTPPTPRPPTRVFWTTDHPLVPADTNGAPDLYGHLLSDLSANGISLMSTGKYAGGVSDVAATDDGSVAVFASRSTDLPGGAGVRPEVYARAGGTTTLLSQPAGAAARVGEVGSGYVERLHAVAANGGVVAFRSRSPSLGVPLAGDHYPTHVFARNVVSGATTLVSVTPGGAPANADAYYPVVDAAGRRIAFVSQATDLVPGVAPGRLHVYVRDLVAGTTVLADRAADGAVAAMGADQVQISGDGKLVVFRSSSPDLPGGDGSRTHIYVVELATGAIVQVDRTADGTAGNGDAFGPDITTDGKRVAFLSRAYNLGGVKAPGNVGAYVKDLATGRVIWASVPQDGATDHDNAVEVALSGDGRRVAFTDDDPQLGYGADGRRRVFVRDLAAGTTELASIGSPGAAQADQRFPSIDGSGRRVTFVQYERNVETRAYLRDLMAKTTVPLTKGRLGAFVASLSASGTCAAFGSYSDDIVSPGFGPDFSHVYLRAIGGDCPPSTGGPGPGPGPGPGSGPDTKAPVISKLQMTSRRFAIASKRTAVSARKARRGTEFRFRLSETARTTITIARAKPGRRSGKRCVKPRKRLRKRCTRYVAVRPVLRRSKTKQGQNRVAFTGRLGKKRLQPGRYRATLVATDAAGNRSKPKSITFTVVRR